MTTQRIRLASSTLAANTRGEKLSSEARRLLSQLATELGLNCPESQWSPRGAGPPKHPALADNWFTGVTHKRGRVIVGVSDQPFGIDLEYFNPRHAERLPGLIELFPELPVQQVIQQAACPQQAFYQAWTLHEALFKLSSQTASPASSVLTTRLQPALEPDHQISLWQGPQWTFAIAGCASPSMEMDPKSLLPDIAPVQFSLVVASPSNNQR